MPFAKPKGPAMPEPPRGRLIVACLLAGLLLNQLPLLGALAWWRPDFLLVLALYWVVHQPRRVGLGTAWGLGLLTDLADGAVLGQHALGYTVAAFGALLLQRRILNFTPVPQALHILPLLFVEQVLGILAATLAGHAFGSAAYFLSVLTGAALWVPVSMLLQWPRRAQGSAEAK